MIEISKKNLIFISVIISVVFLMLGISFGLIYKNKDIIFSDNSEVSEYNSNKLTNKVSNNESYNEIVDESIEETKSENKSDYVDDVSLSNKDNLVVTELNNTLDSISKSRSDANFSDKAKSTFISLVDFVFYDGTIKGITFDELTDKGKEKVLELINKIDKKLEEYAPGYKETISAGASKAFNKASEIIKNGAKNINDFAKDKLGDENYNSIIDAKDELVTYSKDALNFVSSAGSKLFVSTKDKLNSWYQNFKNSN